MDHSPLQEALRPVMAFWVFSALVQSMPKPLPLERWYGWLYGFAQALGANISLIRDKGNPQSLGGPQ